MPLILNNDEVNILRYFGLNTPEEVIDYYRRTKKEPLEDLYLKTIGALDCIRKLR